MKLIFIVFVILFRSIVECVNIKCDYNNNGNYWVVGYIYRCEVSSDPIILSPTETLIESVNGTHKDGKDNDQVEGFYANDRKSILYFPTGLEKCYRNLKLFALFRCSIKEIHQSDLKPFPKLVYFNVHTNQIEVLEEGLFAYNPELAVVSFERNKLVHIHADIFKHLTKLTYLQLDYNKCIDRYVSNNATGVKSIINELPTKCTDGEYSRIKKSLDELEADVKNSTLGMSITLHERIIEAQNQLKNSKFTNFPTLKKQMENILPARFSQGLLRNLTETAAAQQELMIEMDKKFNDPNGKMVNLSEEIKQILRAEILKMGQEQDQKWKLEVEKLANEDEKLQAEMRQSVFSLKVMCYMIVTFCGPLMMIWLLAISEYGGTFLNRLSNWRRETNQEEDSSDA